MKDLPNVGVSVIVRHWDGSQERVTVRGYGPDPLQESGKCVLIKYQDGMLHWWSVREFRAALVVLN